MGRELTWSWVSEVVEVGSGVLGRLQTIFEEILGGYLYWLTNIECYSDEISSSPI